MATHSSVLAWRIPGTAGPGGLPSMGSHRVGHNWSDLAAAAALALGKVDLFLSGKRELQMLIFFRNTLIDIPRNSVLPVIWESLSPIMLTYKISQHNEQNQGCSQGCFGNMTYLRHSSGVPATGLQWLGTRSWLLARLSSILEDIPVNEKPVYNILSLETNSMLKNYFISVLLYSELFRNTVTM